MGSIPTPSTTIMITNYAIAQAATIPDLIVKVNAMISMGWQPLGSINTPDGRIFYQAMVTHI